MSTFELNKWTDQIATIFDHWNAINQFSIMVVCLVDQILNVKVTHITTISVH